MHKFSIEQKKQLLMFITGSDRVPIGGLAKLKLVVARQGPDSNRYIVTIHGDLLTGIFIFSATKWCCVCVNIHVNFG